MDFEDDAPAPEPGEEPRKHAFFRFHEKALLEDVPRVEGGPDVSDAAIRDFVEGHPDVGGGDVDDVADQIGDLADELLGGDEESVEVSCGWRGDWGLATRDPFGYSVLLSADGATVIRYATLRRAFTYEQAKERRRRHHEEVLRRKAVAEEKRERFRLAQEAREKEAEERKAAKQKAREAKAAAKAARREAAAAKVDILPPALAPVSKNRAEARDLVRSVLRGQLTKEEALKRAGKKGYSKEFRQELQRARSAGSAGR